VVDIVTVLNASSNDYTRTKLRMRVY